MSAAYGRHGPAGSGGAVALTVFVPPPRRWRLSDRQVGVLFMVPFILVAAAFILWPVLEAVRLAFYSKSPFRPTMTYVGLDNFRYLFKLGVAAATGVVMLALLFTGSALYLRLIGRQEE